jgi:membrane associated rhomboid family serine protease
MRAEEKSILKSFIPALIFVAILWIVKGVEIYYSKSFVNYGLYPRSIEDLRGIILMPFLHDDLKHLFSNSVPLLILGATLSYFYKEVALKAFFQIWILCGVWLWIGGRPSYHIGASGLVYGLASFIFFSGVLRREKGMMALSLLVVFLYGSMIWGLLPIIQGVSWEGHLFGGLSGALMAWHYRKVGPQRKVYDWEKEEELEDAEVEDHPIEQFLEEPPIDEPQNTNVNPIEENKIGNKNPQITNPNEIKIEYNYLPKNDEKN